MSHPDLTKVIKKTKNTKVTGMQITICWSQIPWKKRGEDQKSCQYLVWPPFASCKATHLLCIELVRLLIVACGMLSHSSSMAVQSCWILVGTGTRCHTHWSRASQTCSMGDMSGENPGHGRFSTFPASRNCVQILATWGRALSFWNMRWWWWMNGTTMGPQDLWSSLLPLIWRTQ